MALNSTAPLSSQSAATASPSLPVAASITGDDVFVARLGGGLVSLSANARAGEDLGMLFTRLHQEARRLRLSAVQGNVFGDPQLHRGVGLHFPVTYLARHDTPAGNLQSARVLALPMGAFARVLDENGAVRGARWETPGARYLLLGALTPPDIGATCADQSAGVWRRLKATLEAQGFALTDLVRTWFFNNRILDWYGDFNRVRTAFFNENAIFGSLVPASTGVGAANAVGAALMLDALAVAPKNGSHNGSRNDVAAVNVSLVPSPLQCPANDYKSAFSRAVEIAESAGAGGTGEGGGRHLLVSGTASIEPGGRTAHVGDLDAQIDLSLRVVAAILESRGMGWTDVSRAILYFPDISWMPRFEARRAALGLPPIPGIYAHCDICRDDLLFEIELDAWKAKD
ncbi:translation initiation inhibitor [Geminisphaera colitermitum]|uniref:translation initiation inhibitor n=1 Tax=Geminisphaera colitermitum TaxID=1148786 RepID=UPI001E285609|nr:translation initiation inhibitor [Geminisphaera colitermitum]